MGPVDPEGSIWAPISPYAIPALGGRTQHRMTPGQRLVDASLNEEELDSLPPEEELRATPMPGLPGRDSRPAIHIEGEGTVVRRRRTFRRTGRVAPRHPHLYTVDEQGTMREFEPARRDPIDARAGSRM